VTYRFSNSYGGTVTPVPVPPETRTFLVAAIVDVSPVLVDQADIGEGAIVPPGATRQLARFYEYAWVGVRLAHGAAGIPALQRELSGLSRQLATVIARATHQPAPNLTFSILDSATVRRQVRQALAPQEIALAVFGAVAGLALLVLAGQGLAGLLSRAAAGAVPTARAVGATRAQAALAVALPGLVAVAGAVALAVAGAFALSPLAPVGPVRRFDPSRGFHADPLVLGAGAVAMALLLAGVLAFAARRVIRPGGGPAGPRPSVMARAAGSAGLPATAVVGSRNAVAGGFGASGSAEAIAGEMEGIAVYEAAAQDPKPDWIMVKAISDWGHAKTDRAHAIAAGNAADLVLHVIAGGGLHRWQAHAALPFAAGPGRA
jgi:hypothetical protein